MGRDGFDRTDELMVEAFKIPANGFPGVPLICSFNFPRFSRHFAPEIPLVDAFLFFFFFFPLVSAVGHPLFLEYFCCWVLKSATGF